MKLDGIFLMWQQGRCGTFAVALMEMFPHLRLGGIDFECDPGYTNIGHFCAHDDIFAYDSLGRHRLPYTGLDEDGIWYPDLGDPQDWGLPQDEAGPEGSTYHLLAAKGYIHEISGGTLGGMTEWS